MPRKKSTAPVDDWFPALRELLEAHADHPLKSRAAARELGVPDAAYGAFREQVRAALDRGALELGPGRTLRLPKKAAEGAITGVFRLTRRGFGFLEVEGEEDDLFVPPDATGGALDGDTVRAEVTRRRRGTFSAQVRIVEVLKRSPANWIGVVEQRGRRWYVQPSGKGASELIEIDDPTAKSVRAGDLVVVEPLPFRIGDDTPRGVVLERLGDESETQAIITSVLRRYELPAGFPADVREAARAAVARFKPDDAAGREDLRGLLTITIDPPDARDFDDAISLEKVDAERVRLGVHIADVAYFVQPGSALDREAYDRSTSVYFPRRVIPMLPELLSNGVCSLQPAQPRYAMSVFIDYDRTAKVVGTSFARSVIQSRVRLTYDQVTQHLHGTTIDVPDEVRWLLTAAERLARRIQQRRLRAGMITLAMPEPELIFGDDDRVVDVRPEDTSFSHTLIEMFMVEANEAVCRLFRRLDTPHLRRVHPPPAESRTQHLERLQMLLGEDATVEIDRKTLQGVIERARGTPAESAVSYLVLRSMSQAFYAPGQHGHYALASDDYCHFTSPIRRYPDLVAHRILAAYLADQLQKGGTVAKIAPATLAEAGRHTSARERAAQQAEREVKAALLLRFLEDKVGEECDGTVTAVESYGVFVQLRRYLTEGLVPLEALGPERWEYDEHRGTLRGKRSYRVIATGQSVRVRIVEVSPLQMELTLAPHPPGSFGVAASLKKRKPAKTRRAERGAGRKSRRR